MKNLQPGSSGKGVEMLQKRLSEFGFYEGEITGNFDERTAECVREFQAKRELAVDGLVGMMTLHELDLLNFAETSLEEKA